MYNEVTVDCWNTAKKVFGNSPLWIFRGQENNTWYLQTTLERGASDFNCHKEKLPGRELWILRQFQKKAQHHIPSPPKIADLIEWLAIIQHHGGPTRLLDFTHSFYIATYFAVERAKQNSAVWAINLFNLKKKIKEQFGPWEKSDTIDDIYKKHVKLAEKYIINRKTDKSILFFEPTRLPERLSNQQGIFLMPCDVTSCFMDNLFSAFNMQKSNFEIQKETIDSNSDLDIRDFKQDILKIIIQRDIHKTAIDDLRKMNISSASLFPGLDGFARSLYYHLRFDEISSDSIHDFIYFDE